MFGVARYLKSGDFINSGGVSQYRTTRVRLETEPELPVNIDGEVVAMTPQEFSVAQNALKVLVPHESTSAHRDFDG
jgi:diacylglycerol kinase family enzyme